MRFTVTTCDVENFSEELACPIFEETGADVPAAHGVMDARGMVAQWKGLLQANMGKTWVVWDGDTPVGLLGALFMNDFYSGKPMALELFWFVRKAWRKTRAALLLFRAFEDEARLRRCDTTWAGTNTFTSPLELGKFYARNGFTYWGATFRKVNRYV